MNKPQALKEQDTIGIFTPSHPAYIENEEKFKLGIQVLESLGFKVKLGFLTEKRMNEGYRPANGKLRAQEFMELYCDPNVKCLMATIGGNNSNSLIEYLDYAYIQKHPKIVCGYSDVTSLHLALLHYGKLQTFYGPTLMTGISEFPKGDKGTIESFLKATSRGGSYRLEPFLQWSNHFRDWGNGDWKNLPRKWNHNEGPQILRKVKVKGSIIIANLSTLMDNAGTEHFPDFENKILLLESMTATWPTEERYFVQLKHLGVFSRISGLIIGKPEVPNSQRAPFSHEELILEIIGDRDFPIISKFDLSHTLPMHTLAQMTLVELDANNGKPTVEVLESMVT
jgi:muramoyltetrapeptide carboxypeptidase LdcA involved in peptidoglycan recycling